MKYWKLLLVALCGSWTVPASVHASPLLEMFGGFGGAGGQQARNVAGGAAAAYFNPALLLDAPVGLTFGVGVLGSRMGITLHGRGEGRADVPNGLENGAHENGDRWESYPFGTQLLQQGRPGSASSSATTARPRQGAGTGKEAATYEAVGLVVRLLREQLAFGFYTLLPNGNFTRLRSFYVDEREQYLSNSLHAEMYGDRMRSLAIAFGAGYRLTKSLSIGAGSTISLRAVAGTPVFVADASKLTDLTLNMDANVHVSLAPHGGFAWNPVPRWRITGTVHSPQKIEVGANINFLLASGLEQQSALKFVFDYMPWQAGLGTAYDLLHSPRSTLTFAASAVYGRWSQYVDRHGEKPLPVFAWKDTITGALGLRWKGESLGLHADLQYKPTPVPLQYGRSNYVDNDRIGTCLGSEYGFSLMDTAMRVGVQMQAYFLLARSVRKLTTPTFPDGINRTPALVRDEVPDDGQVGGTPIPGAIGLQTNNPGWPGFASHGWLTTASLYLSVAL